MNRSMIRRIVARLGLVTLPLIPTVAGAGGPQFREWSEPVHLGPVVNSSAHEFSPVLSPDGLSLYFASNRTEGFGGFDLWVSHRDCEACAWEQPVPLGPNINSANDELSAAFSPSGHLLFFASAREGPGRVFGDTDIWVSFRRDRHDDFGWGSPINLGPFVNTDGHEIDPAFLPGRFWLGRYTFYFVRDVDGEQDIYEVDVGPLGIPRGPAVAVTEINAAGATDGSPSFRRDGLEIVFWSDRVPGRVGGADIWSATRPHVRAPWSPPVNLGGPVNTTFAEITVSITFDGTQLFMAKGQQLGGLGLRDLWMSTRERIDE